MAGEEPTLSPVSNSQRTVPPVPSQPVRHKHKANKAREMGFIDYLVVSKEICGSFILATRQLGQQAHRVSDDLSQPHGKHHRGGKACAGVYQLR